MVIEIDGATVARVKTMADGGRRLELDLLETTRPSDIGQLFEAQRLKKVCKVVIGFEYDEPDMDA